jgi:predicted AlkP superfamily pyrophosphatase or phosphodiesterase
MITSARRLGPWALLILCALGLAPAAQAQPTVSKHKLLVLSVDGLDWRYLRDRDALGLKIPNLRRLMAQGAVASGVVGVWPTITWPSHTSIITGVRPDQHGILGNAARGVPFTESYWSARTLKAQTLWQCAGQAGLTTAAVTWPVTVDAAITYNLPEAAMRRNGGSMDLDSVNATATPGLAADITRLYPSFAQQWVDDRTRTQAVLYLLKVKQPDLILAHLVDLDSEEHDQGPFAANANAILERTDELIGDIAAALPQDYDWVITSDHGFERLDRTTNLAVAMAQAGVKGELQASGGLATTKDPAVAAWLRAQSGKAGSDVGREVPHAELALYAPALGDAAAAFEPVDHVMFFGRGAEGPLHAPPREKGEHGFWPLRHDYRSVFIAYGPGVRPGSLPELQMVDLNDRLATLMGIRCHAQLE